MLAWLLSLFRFPASLWKPWSLLLRISPSFPLPPLLWHRFLSYFVEIYLLTQLIYIEYGLDRSGSPRCLEFYLQDYLIWFPTSKHFNVGSTLLLGWYDVATRNNHKSTLKQHCVPQRRNLQRWTTSNQRCVFQLQYEQHRTTSKQRCYFQHRVLQRWVTSKQRCGYDLLQNNQNKPWERVKLYFSALNENHLKVKARSS